ncbi:MAG: MCE family protein [Muribaculaceae bacterium]|jgi:phospholipid/cholesterol/gamma-HCH transport system substrate-binding protein|nr:MCE family protein [Muribaculaceae bacterium]
MKKKYSKELLIGLTVLITLLIIFFGIDYLKGVNVFKAANYYYASYTDVAGLAQSAPVTVNGYKVGLVREIEYEYDNPGHIKVELSLDRKLKVPQGSEAVLVTDMLGTSSIELRLADKPDFHTVGDKLIGVNSKGLMDNVSNELLPAVGNMVPKIDSLLTAVTALVSDPALTNSVKRLDNVMANLETSTRQLTTVMASTPSIAADAKVTMGNVTEISKNLTAISSDLAAATAELKKMPLDSTLANVHQITSSLEQLTSKLNSKESSAGLLLTDPQLYNNLVKATASVDSLLVDIKRNPKRYISIKLL